MPEFQNQNQEDNPEEMKFEEIKLEEVHFLPDYQRSTYLLLRQLKDHIVQIEALATYLFFCLAVMYFITEVELPVSKWLIVGTLMASYKLVMRVTNPNGAIRNRLTWATALGGIGAAVGAAIDVASFGLTAGQASLIGLGAGAALGTALGNIIEKSANKDDLIERGEAFKILFAFSKKNPNLANPKLVEEALDKIPSYDINQDGRKWYSRIEVNSYCKK